MSKFSIEDYVYKRFDDVIPYGGTDLSVECPFCESRIGNPDSKSHLNISLVKQVVHCFRCDYSANWIRFIMELDNVPYHRAIGLLYDVPSKVNEFSKLTTKSGSVPQKDPPQPKYGLPGDFIRLDEAGQDGKFGRSYLKMRGFNKWHIRRYNIGMADSIPDRVIIPIEKGYWQGRAIFKWMKPKYMNPKLETTDVIFNARAMEEYDEIVVCEGAFSAMAVGENAIAIMKNSISNDKLERILTYNVGTFIIALEPGAFVPMKPFMDSLQRNGKKVIVWKYSVGDPADPDSNFQEIVYDFKNKLSFMIGI